MAANSAAVKFVDLRKENEHEDLNLEEKGGSSKDAGLLVKVEMNTKQDKFITRENQIDSPGRYIKWLSISVTILFLMCLATIIASMVKIRELKHETLQKTVEIRELTDLQMNISKGNENRLEEVIQNQTKREDNLLSRIQEISEILFRNSCDDPNPSFTNIEKGKGTIVRILSSIAGGGWAYCQNIDGQIWTVFQRRQDGSVDFFRNWNDYVRGFGYPFGEFWLGLEAIHQMTKTGQYQLRIDMEVQNGTRVYAAYSSFSIGSGSEYYPSRVSGYTGNATDSLKAHNNRKFTTKDADNDRSTIKNCALLYHGAWWYSSCYNSNLNGLYGDNSSSGVTWWQRNQTRGFNRMSMRFTEMKLKKKQ